MVRGFVLCATGAALLVGCETTSSNEEEPGRARFELIGVGPVAWRVQQEFTVPPPFERLEAIAMGADDLLLGTTGSALLYSRGPGGWTLTSRLTTNDPFDVPTTIPSDTFGSSVALSGDTALVGCAHCKPQGTDSGAVYVYTRSGSSWSLQQVLTSTDEAAGDLFGKAVALDEDTAILTSNKGAHVFTRSAGNFSELGTLATPSLGTDVALKGNLAVVVCNSVSWLGSPYPDEMPSVPTGAVLFTRTGDVWSTPLALPGTQTAAHAAVAGDHALVTNWDRTSGFAWKLHYGSWLEFASNGALLQEHDSGSQIATSSRGVLVSTSELMRQSFSEAWKPTNRSPAMLWEPDGSVYDFAPQPALDFLAMSSDYIAFARSDGNVRVLVRYTEPQLECSHDDDCLSQHCVDGICCDTACTADPCQSCKGAEKGYGPDGVCDWIATATKTSCGEPDCERYTPNSEINYSVWAAMTHECRDRVGCVDIPESCGEAENSCEHGACVTSSAGGAGSGGEPSSGGSPGSELGGAGPTPEGIGAGGDESGTAGGGAAPTENPTGATPTPGSVSASGLPRQRKKSDGGCNLTPQPATGGAEALLLFAAGLWRRRKAHRGT